MRAIGVVEVEVNKQNVWPCRPSSAVVLKCYTEEVCICTAVGSVQ